MLTSHDRSNGFTSPSNEISECIQVVASYKMVRVGIIVAITSLAFLCNCFVGGQHDPIRPMLSESFLAEVGILSLGLLNL